MIAPCNRSDLSDHQAKFNVDAIDLVDGLEAL